MSDFADGKPAVDDFEDEIRAVVSRFAAARLLTLAEAIGTLHVVAASIIAAATEDDDG